MSAIILRLSSEPIIMLPADLAQRAGLQEGAAIQAIVLPGSLELRVANQEAAYQAEWPARRARLRECAAALGLQETDRRDDEYWQIVTPLMEELDHELYT